MLEAEKGVKRGSYIVDVGRMALQRCHSFLPKGTGLSFVRKERGMGVDWLSKKLVSATLFLPRE